jgi:hypothetical protein
MADFSQLFMGAPARIEQAQRYNPQQQNAFQSVLGQGLQGLQNPYAGFEPIAQRAQSQFYQQTVPTLAERFAGSGSNALSSPAFASQIGQAGSGLAEGLAALQSQYGMQNRAQSLSMLQQGLTPQFENIPMAGEGGALDSLLPLLAKLAIHGGSAYATGGTSAVPTAIMELMKLLSGGQ